MPQVWIEFIFQKWPIQGNPRFKCRDCCSTQTQDANTPLYDLKLKGKWIDLTFVMFDTEFIKSCSHISKELRIDYHTAFRRRHKFRCTLNSAPKIEICEETELDDVFSTFYGKGCYREKKYDEYYSPGDPMNVESAFRIEEKLKDEDGFQSVFLCTQP